MNLLIEYFYNANRPRFFLADFEPMAALWYCQTELLDVAPINPFGLCCPRLTPTIKLSPIGRTRHRRFCISNVQSGKMRSHKLLFCSTPCFAFAKNRIPLCTAPATGSVHLGDRMPNKFSQHVFTRVTLTKRQSLVQAYPGG